MPLVIAPRLLHHRGRRHRHLVLLRRPQHQRHQHHYDALAKAEPQEGGFVAARLDHIGDRDNGERRSGAKSRGGESGGEAAAIRKPFKRVADRAAVDDTSADTADRRTEIEQEQRVGDRIDHPGDRHQKARAADHDARAELVDEIALDRHQPRLRQHEDCECDLNRRPPPVVFVFDRTDEQRPAVLQVGDHHHADDAEDQLPPTGRVGRERAFRCRSSDCHCCCPPSGPSDLAIPQRRLAAPILAFAAVPRARMSIIIGSR